MTSTDGRDGDLSVEEVARQLGLPVDLLIRRLRAGLLPGRSTMRDGAEEWWLPAAALGDAVSRPPAAALPSLPVADSSPVDDLPWNRVPLPSAAPAAETVTRAEDPAADAPVPAPSTPSPAAQTPSLPFVPPTVGAPWPVVPPPLAWARAAAPRPAASPAASPAPAAPAEETPPVAPVAAPMVGHRQGGDPTEPPVEPPVQPVPATRASPVEVMPARGGGDGTGLTEAIGRVDIDARELVAALLERWERTYALRIEAEMRLRYEGTINELRAQVARHEGELERMQAEVGEASALHAGTAAEHRAALADRDREVAAMREQLQARLAAIMERDRLIADRDRALTDRDRALDETRRTAAAAPPARPARRSWWGRRTEDGRR